MKKKQITYTPSIFEFSIFSLALFSFCFGIASLVRGFLMDHPPYSHDVMFSGVKLLVVSAICTGILVLSVKRNIK